MGRPRGERDGWCILRTSGGRTIPLARSLSASGIEAWTPIEKRAHRLRGGRKGTVEREAPILPTFVFAKAVSLQDLLSISTLPMSPHPAFSVFRYLNAYVEVKDREVERLRLAEARSVPKAKRPTLPVGAKVQVEEGPYTGMPGKVVKSTNGMSIVFFGGWMSVEIETLKLTVVDVEDTQPISGIAAAAA